jgi:hypothetical protein
VDGKKKRVPGMNADTAEQGRQELNENQEALKEKAQRQETKEEQDIRRPRAISNLQAQGQESERKFTPMDVNEVGMNNEDVETESKRNPDGSICEDCN